MGINNPDTSVSALQDRIRKAKDKNEKAEIASLERGAEELKNAADAVEKHGISTTARTAIEEALEQYGLF